MAPPGAGGTIAQARLALASVAPTPIRAPTAERKLVGERPSAALFEEAGRLAAQDARPISDMRGSADYRRTLVAVLMARALADCCRKLGLEVGSHEALLNCTINGEDRSVLVDTRDTLLDLLRDRLGLTGTKEGCGNGNCGTCTVLMDGAPINACLVLARRSTGPRPSPPSRALRSAATLHPLQQALVEHGGTQCGFCTPGIVLAAKALLDDNPSPSEAQIRHAIAGNLCRCTGYGKIVEAIAAVAAAPGSGGRPDDRWARSRAALKVIGQRLPRVDARERVTGEARYPADIALPGMAHAKLLRSPHAHARIRRIDTTRAAALSGVLAVVSAADFPELPVGASIPMGEIGYDMWMVAQINMARRKVHWVGQPVAAVAAVDAHVAEAALALIEVDYEPLPAVLDIAAAMAADAPVLHDHVFTKGIEPRPRTPGNVCSRTVIARGDAQAALDTAPRPHA